LLDVNGTVSHCIDLLDHLSYPSASIIRMSCIGVLVRDVNVTCPVLMSRGGWGEDGKSMQSLFVECDSNSITFRGWTTCIQYPYDNLETAQMDIHFEEDDADFSYQGGVVGALKALPLSSLQILHIDDVMLDEHGWFDAFHDSLELRIINFQAHYATGLLKVLNSIASEEPGNLLFPQLCTLILSGVRFDREGYPLSAGSSKLLQACMDKRRRCNAAIKELRLEHCTGISKDGREVRRLKKLVDHVVRE
jgi:hypothetical protein